MFRKINQILSCKICKNVLEDPVLLPCGETICSEHVLNNKVDLPGQRTLTSQVFQFKCLICKANHYENHMFPRNKALMEIIKLGLHIVSLKPNSTEPSEKLVVENNYYLSTKDSFILNDQSYQSLCKLCGYDKNLLMSLVYRATGTTFDLIKFHKYCDFMNNILFVVQSNSNIFGAFSNETWDGHKLKMDPNSFIFSLINKEQSPVKLIAKNGTGNIWTNPDMVCQFGQDLIIGPKQGGDFLIGQSNLGFQYDHPKYKFNTKEAKQFLAGYEVFKIDFIEIFWLNSKFSF